jgi:4-hydroxy-tetrahydrodipicolinate reductase
MGRLMTGLARARADVEVVGGIGRSQQDDVRHVDHDPDVPVVDIDRATDVIANADVVIDVSAPAATRALLDRAGDALAGRSLVIGTTGLDAATRERVDGLAAHTAVLTVANFSLGVNLLLDLAERVAAVLDPARYDIEVIEAHHRGKADAPSGTALALGAAVARGRNVELESVRRDGRSGSTGARPDGEVGFHAVRGGGIAGEHRVLFAGERELIELRHEALDRAVFAEGALAAAIWIAGRKAGRYTMQDVLGL